MTNGKYSETKTEANLKTAFLAESRARNKYTFFASKARKEGFEQIAEIFERLAANEKEHAEIWYKELYFIGDTATNLEEAADDENEEGKDQYIRFAKTACDEGFTGLAEKFRQVGKIECKHEQILRTLLNNIIWGEVFAKTGINVWECRNCGHIVISCKAPEICPVCEHPKAYFQTYCENY